MAKKIFLTTLFAMFLFTVAMAQQNSSLEFGFSGGYNTTIMTDPGSYLYPPGYTHGFNAGLSAEYYCSADIGIKINLIYDQIGYTYPQILYYVTPAVTSFNVVTPVNTAPNFTHFELNYLTVPLVLNVHFGKKRNWYLNFGGYAGLLLNTVDTKYHSDIQNNYNRADGGIAIGAGFKFPISKNLKLFIELDGQYGLANTLKGVDEPTGSFENERSAVNIGLNFR